MFIRSFFTVVPPHRIAGGIGLLLIGAGISSATHRVTPPTPFQAAGMTPNVSGLQRQGRQSLPDGGGAESETAFRGFSLADTADLPRFAVTNLSKPLQAGEQFDIIMLSQNGAVLGTVIPARDNSVLPGAKRPAPRTRAARWEKDTIQRFPIPPGTDRVVGGDMNDRGDIAAVSIRYRRGKPSFNRVLLYPRASAYKDLGTLDVDYEVPDTNDPALMRGVSENLICLNNQGALTALVASKSWFRRADGTRFPIGDGIAFDLNNRNVAVGFVGNINSGAVMWRNIVPAGKSTVTALLPSQKTASPGGQPYWRGSGECVNDRGDAVVAVPVDTAGGFRRLGRTAYYILRGGKLQLIAQMRGYQRSRTRINISGDVVGFMDTDPQSQSSSPILYRSGRMYDLSNIAQQSGWQIIGAVDINDRGQLLAYGMSTDQPNSVVPILLSPERK